MSWPFDPLERGHYKIVYADPPWSFRTWSAKGEGRSASRHYKTLSLEQIGYLPVWDLAAEDSVLFLWVIQSMLPGALGVIDAWGFTYKTVAFVWAKPKIGLGYHTRAQTEQCWIATRGKGYVRQSRSVKQLVMVGSTGHSAKPPEVRDRIVQLVGDVPRVELFARERAPGWSCWGNQLEQAT